MVRLSGVAFGATVAAALLAGQALADSRIFTARASAPGVTIEQASRNGQELLVVGRGDGTTLFRIDEPSTVVGCANRLDFVTSTGEKVNLAADLCVLDWEVIVEVAGAAPAAEPPPAGAATDATSPPLPPDGPPPPPPPAAAEAPAIPDVPAAPGSEPTVPGATFKQAVSVTLDDPAVTVTAVTLDGASVPIAGRDDAGIRFEIEGSEQGIVCQRRLGLTLSDGRTIERDANLCLNDWTVLVALADAPPPPAATAEAPPPAPEAPRAWSFAEGEVAATLVFGMPETDDTVFTATCTRGSDRITVTLYEATAPGLAPGATVPVTFSAGGFSKTFQGTMGAVDQMSAASHPEVVTAAGDPLWPAIISQANLGIIAGPAYSATLSLKGSAGPARQLVAACLDTPQPAAGPLPPAAPQQAGGAITARYACEVGQGFTVTFYGSQGRAVLTESGAPPLTLQWMPEGVLGRYVAGEARLALREDHVRWSRLGERPRTCFPR